MRSRLSAMMTLVGASVLTSCQYVAPSPSYPKNIGYVIFPAYQPLDVMGPLDILSVHSWSRQLNLHLIAQSLDPVTIKPQSAAMNLFNSSFGFTINPTHTFETAQNLDLDVLFVPGGLGTRNPNITNAVQFVRDTYPRLKYLISVCTGAEILARSGVLDGRNATTNKAGFNETAAYGPRTNWIGRARWVQDGNIWTTSGVAAGMDGTLAWISHIWNETTAVYLSNVIEYDWHRNASWDPFAELHGVRDVPPQV